MRAMFNRCMECDEIVTNPICSECLAERMRTAVAEDSPKLAKLITGINTMGETLCLFCHHSVGLCAHCFSKDVHELIAENNPQLAKKFMVQFDFELRTKTVDFE